MDFDNKDKKKKDKPKKEKKKNKEKKEEKTGREKEEKDVESSSASGVIRLNGTMAKQASKKKPNQLFMGTGLDSRRFDVVWPAVQDEP